MQEAKNFFRPEMSCAEGPASQNFVPDPMPPIGGAMNRVQANLDRLENYLTRLGERLLPILDNRPVPVNPNPECQVKGGSPVYMLLDRVDERICGQISRIEVFINQLDI